jgi:hypothetical protein
MGVERKSPRVSIFSSFLMIILAGTAFRMTRLSHKIIRTQLNKILEQFGNQMYSAQGATNARVLPSEVKLTKGEQTIMREQAWSIKRIQKIAKLAKWLSSP